jgi:hypothetical protein
MGEVLTGRVELAEIPESTSAKSGSSCRRLAILAMTGTGFSEISSLSASLGIRIADLHLGQRTIRPDRLDDMRIKQPLGQ